MNQPLPGLSSSPGEPVEEHLEDPTSPTLDQKPTKEQVELLLLALKLKHGLTNSALEDIMHLINFSAGPGGELVSGSKYLFYKAFDSVKDILEVQYVCKSCNVSMQEGPFNVKCPVCDQDTSKAHAQKDQCFLYLPLKYQIKKLLEDHQLGKHLKHRFEKKDASFNDIYDGYLYKKLSPLASPENISLTFNCDGVPVHKSNTKSLWPILCTVNELPIQLRAKHVMLCGLWFGQNKPNMNTYMKPFVDECIELYSNGLIWQSESGEVVTSKVLLTTMVADSVARPLIQNFKQFNGEFGCSFCMQKGTTVLKRRGRVRAYPYEKAELRNPSQTDDLVEEALAGNPTKGVKGPSILSCLPDFNIIDGCVPDYMHSVLLGVARSITTLWFHSENNQSPWYIGRSTEQIDDILTSIKPPCNVSRVPHSVKEKKFWKAHEWNMWLFYYSIPTLKGVLPEKYLKHWFKLVKGVSLLLGENISPLHISESEGLLTEFVQEMETLYGINNVTFNVHLCLHLPNTVRNWGPLWAQSAFVFESYNGIILDMIKSSQGVSLQIMKTVWLQVAFPSFSQKTMVSASDDYLALLESFSVEKKMVQEVSRSHGVTSLGRPKICMIRNDDFLALNSISNLGNRVTVKYFCRVVVNDEIVHSQNYSRTFRRNSYTVILSDREESIFSVKTFIVCDLGQGETCYAVGKYYQKVKQDICGQFKNPCYFIPVGKSLGPLVAIQASQIKEKCLFINTVNRNVDIVFKFINHSEMLR